MLFRSRAALRRHELNLEYRKVRVPFDGVVETRPVEVGDYLQPGSVCAEVVDLNPMLIVTQVTEEELGGLKPGEEATATLRDGSRLTGKISYIAQVADPVTRTYRVEAEVVNADYRIQSGLSATVNLPKEELYAHFVSPALLSLTDTGALGIKVIETGNTVKFYEVKIVSDTDKIGRAHV